MIRARQLAGASVGFGAVTLWLAALGLLTTPLLIDRLGTTAYGTFALVTVLAAYLGNLELGFGHATVRFLAHARGAGDAGEEARVLGTGLAVFLAAAVAGAGLALAGAPWIVRTFVDADAAVRAQALAGLRLGAAVIALSFLSSFASSALQALGAFGAVLGARLVCGTASSVAAAAVVLAGGDLVGVLAAGVAVSTAQAGWLMLALRRAAGAPLRPRIDRATLRAMAGYGALVLATGVAFQALLQGPPTVLAAAGTPAQVAAFAVPALVLSQLAALASATSLAFLPYVAASGSGTEALRGMFCAHLRLTLLVMGPAAGFLAAFAEPLLSAWIDPAFAAAAAGPMRWLALGGLLIALSAAPADVARGLGHAGWVATFTAGAGVIAVGGSLLLVGPSGPAGVGAALGGALLLATVPFALVVARRLLHLDARAVGSALAGPALALAASGGTFLLGAELTDGLGGAVVAGAVGTAVHLALAGAVVLDPRERAALAVGRRRPAALARS